MARATTLLLGIILVITHAAKGTLRYSNQLEGTPYQRNESDLVFISKCVYDNANDLVCYFEVDPNAGPLKFAYQYPGGNSYLCPLQGDSNCTWRGDSKSYAKSTLKHLLFLYNDTPKYISNIVVMTPVNELKPSKVLNVAASSTNTSVNISWEAPQLAPTAVIGKLQYLYRIKLFHKENEEDERNTTEESIIFNGLIPYESYSLEICARNNTESGYWSDPYKISVKTKPGVPIANPEYVGYYNLNETHVKIIWKPLDIEKSRGPNVLYNIIEHGGQFEKNGISESSVIFQLDENQSHVIQLYASHSFGRNSSIYPTVLRISWPRKEVIKELSPLVDSQKNVVFYWSPGVNVTKYNLLWCEGSATNKGCKSTFQWGHITEQEMGKLCNISAGMTYNFAISANYPGQEQGPLTWSTCNYVKGKPIKKPKQPFQSALMKAGELHVEWSRPSCGDTGYIQNYIVHYCLSSNCSKPVEVEVPSTVNHWQTAAVQPGQQYDVWIGAKSPEEESETSERLTVRVKSNTLARGIIAAIVIFVIATLGLIAFVVAHIVRSYKKKMEELAITLPEKEKLHIEDESLSYNYMTEMEQVNRPESRNSDNVHNASREGFESRTSENVRNEYQERKNNNIRNVT